MNLLKSSNIRLGLLILVLLGSVALVFGGNSKPKLAKVGEVVASTQGGASSGQSEEILDLSVFKRRGHKKEFRDVFVEFRSELPPAPVVFKKSAPVVESPPVVAPPEPPQMPLRYIGRMNNGVPKVFLAKGDNTFTVAVSDVVENTYKLESMTDNTLEFTYLPLGIRQTLNLQTDR